MNDVSMIYHNTMPRGIKTNDYRDVPKAPPIPKPKLQQVIHPQIYHYTISIPTPTPFDELVTEDFHITDECYNRIKDLCKQMDGITICNQCRNMDKSLLLDL
jgi:hypothetical protein